MVWHMDLTDRAVCQSRLQGLMHMLVRLNCTKDCLLSCQCVQDERCNDYAAGDSRTCQMRGFSSMRSAMWNCICTVESECTSPLPPSGDRLVPKLPEPPAPYSGISTQRLAGEDMKVAGF